MAKNRRSTGRVTLSDVALAAGVSPITVSRALRGERAVSPELVTRVTQASERLGYVPDPAARAQRQTTRYFWCFSLKTQVKRA